MDALLGERVVLMLYVIGENVSCPTFRRLAIKLSL
jgi:hypothetical protein